VEAIYAAAPDPSLWPRALQAIADVFGDVGTVMVYGRDDGNWGAIASASMVPMAIEHQRVFKGADLRAIRGVERGVYLERDAVTDRPLVSDEEIETHPYYRLMAKHGLKYFVAVPVSPTPNINVSISVQRAVHKPAYRDEELAVLPRLGRH